MAKTRVKKTVGKVERITFEGTCETCGKAIHEQEWAKPVTEGDYEFFVHEDCDA